MATHSDEDASDDVAMVRGAMTATAALEENIDLDANDLSRTTTPTTPALDPAQTAATAERPYSAFSEGQKWFIITLAAVGATTS